MLGIIIGRWDATLGVVCAVTTGWHSMTRSVGVDVKLVHLLRGLLVHVTQHLLRVVLRGTVECARIIIARLRALLARHHLFRC